MQSKATRLHQERLQIFKYSALLGEPSLFAGLLQETMAFPVGQFSAKCVLLIKALAENTLSALRNQLQREHNKFPPSTFHTSIQAGPWSCELLIMPATPA